MMKLETPQGSKDKASSPLQRCLLAYQSNWIISLEGRLGREYPQLHNTLESVVVKQTAGWMGTPDLYHVMLGNRGMGTNSTDLAGFFAMNN